MKTSKSNVRCRFGRLLSGILSAAMLFSAAAFQIPVSATGEEAGGYEVLYDFMKDYTLEPDNANISKTDDVIKVKSIGGTNNITAVLSDEISDKTEGKKVRLHYDFKWESGSSLIRFENKVFETENESDKLRLGFMQKKLNDTTPYLAYGSGQNCDYNYYETNKITNPNGFSADTWYSVDTIYEFDNDKVVYYIDGNKVGETSLNGFSKIKMMMFSIHEWDSEQQYYGQTNYCYKNMKLDTGMAAQITDTNDNGATLMFTNPTALDSSDITVKCLETGETLTVTVTKVNDMKYNLSYSTGTNIGGDYMLTFSDAFAVINGISEKTIAYSQKPSVSYDYYIDDDFESYNSGVTLWSKNSSINREKIEYHNGGLAEEWALSPNYSVYGAMDNDRKVIEVNLSECTEERKQKAMEMGFKYAIGDYKVTEDSNGAKGNFKVSFDVKNVDNKNENVTATGDANRFALGTNAWGTFILGLSKNKLYIYTKSDGSAPDNDTPAKSFDLSETDNGYHHIDILFDFTNNNQKIMADDTEYYNGVMYSTLQSRGLAYLTFMQRKCSNSTWSDTNYGEAYTLIDNLNVINLDSASTSGIKSVQYSSDGINYSPAIGKVDSATKYVKIDFTSAMDTSTLSDINLSNGSNTVAATGTASNDNKTYTLELTDNLALNTDYTLNIPMSVKTAGGNSFAREYNGRITTTAGVFKIDLLDIQKGGVSVTKSNIGANDTIDAVVNITNTEGREGEVYLCICVYNNDVMTQVNFDKINLKTESTKSVPITVASAENIKVKAFLWENFATMKPLVKNKTVE